MSWTNAREAWFDFLNEIEASRNYLNCSYSNAWFRGHSNSAEYKVQPSLFRVPNINNPDFQGEHNRLFKEIKSYPTKLKRLKLRKKELKHALYNAYKNNKEEQNKYENEFRNMLTRLTQQRLVRLVGAVHA